MKNPIQPYKDVIAPPPVEPSVDKAGSKQKSGMKNDKSLFQSMLKHKHLDIETLKDNLDIKNQSTKKLGALTLVFLLFYILFVGLQARRQYNNEIIATQKNQLVYTQGLARQINGEINNSLIWINNAISMAQTPAQANYLISRSPNILAVMARSKDGKIIAASPANNRLIRKIPAIDNKNNIAISSVIDEKGNIFPLIIKPNGNYDIIALLQKNTLIKTHDSQNKIAILSASGRPVSGDNMLGKQGAITYFGINDSELKQLTKIKTASIKEQKTKGVNTYISTVKIPNTNLVVLSAKPYTPSAIMKQNLIMFLLFFVGTAVLLFVLLRSLQKQLKISLQAQEQSEISKQRYRAAIESGRGGIWEISLAESSAFVSASLADLLGLLRKDQTIALAEFLNLFYVEDREKLLSLARRAHLQEEFEFDIRVAKLPLILQCRGRSSTRSDNNMQRVIVGVASDITEQRMAQARLKMAEDRLHDALSSMTDSFVVWDNQNRIVLWNAQFENFFIPSGKIYPGMTHAEVNHLAFQNIKSWQEFENNSEVWTEYTLNDGRHIRYVETNTSDGGHVSVGTDITEIRQREAELEKNEHALQNSIKILKKSQDRIVELAERYERERNRAEEASQSKSDFLASMSHELRTPLNAINGFSDIMQKEMFGPLGDPRYKEYVKDILFSGQHLLSLINDILDMSKIEAGKMTLNTEVVFLHEIVAQVVRIVRGRAIDAQLKIVAEVDEVHEIEADPRYVKQVLLNLMTNAIKFTPEGGTVGVKLIEKQSGIIVKVFDTGIGISKENIEKLAKPFEQVTEDAAKQTEGTGLGLALSKSLVELHGGKFKIDSVVGKGTTVMFSLPNKPIETKKQDDKINVSQEISRITSDISSIIDKSHASQPVNSQNPYAKQSGNASGSSGQSVA